MSPRIAYWTSAFEPGVEAIATEVAALRRHFPNSVSWGLSHRHWLLASRSRGLCFHPRLHLVFRGLVRLLEPSFDINHIFGSPGDWFYLAPERCRPTVLTVAAWTDPVEIGLLKQVDQFVVESVRSMDELVRLGIDNSQIRLIFPAVDLERYVPREPPDGPFTVLFASSPDRAEWMEARGVHLILDAAALRPDMRFRMLWRPWGDSEPVVRRWIAERGLQNVELIVGWAADMPSEYSRAHAVLAPFTDMNRSKPTPNSVVDSLACGRPAVVTDLIGLADLVAESHSGCVVAPTGGSLAESLDQIAGDWRWFSRCARRLAQEMFSIGRFVESYERLYAELLPQFVPSGKVGRADAGAATTPNLRRRVGPAASPATAASPHRNRGLIA
jgi:glycosyltransferase involved in cell wall biosynthesis